jgi:RNA polymerase primary sigma factor
MSVATPKTSGAGSVGESGRSTAKVSTFEGLRSDEGATVKPGLLRGETRGPGLSQAEEAFLGRELEAGQNELAAALSLSRGAVDELRRTAHSVQSGALDLTRVVHTDPDESTPMSAEEWCAQVFGLIGEQEQRLAEGRERRLPAANAKAHEAWLELRLNAKTLEHLVQAHRARLQNLPPERQQAEVAASEAMARAQRRIQSARSVLVTSHLRLATLVAKSFRNRGVSVPDLVQEASIGLMLAAERFDYRKGFRFATYAAWWIRAAVRACIANQGRTIRVPVRRLQEVARLKRSERVLAASLGRNPDSQELAAYLGVSATAVEQLKEIVPDAVSADAAPRENSVSGYEQFIDPAATSPLTELASGTIQRETQALLSELTAREAEVIRLRFGIGNRSDLTLEEIGRHFGVTRERVRQIEARALAKMRRPGSARELETLLGS